jgi:hypothetical protein
VVKGDLVGHRGRDLRAAADGQTEEATRARREHGVVAGQAVRVAAVRMSLTVAV